MSLGFEDTASDTLADRNSTAPSCSFLSVFPLVDNYKLRQVEEQEGHSERQQTNLTKKGNKVSLFIRRWQHVVRRSK